MTERESENEDPRATAARQRMVDALTTGATRSEAVVAALQRVPRHVFVDPFWAPPPGTEQPAPSDSREWRTIGDAVADYALEVAYSPQRAVVIVPPGGDDWPTSTASAPNLVADMIELLQLQPGMRVLEIGAGSGYNAALLSEVLDDPSAVTSIDIDAAVVERARKALERTGYGGVRILHGDGFIGDAADAPFDRIVATVGCTDLSPHWLEQLGENGFVLVPLEHGGAHPILRAVRDGAGATGSIVARSGFVRVQGAMAAMDQWPFGRSGLAGRWRHRPLPADVHRTLSGSKTGEWDFGYYLALVDRRVANLARLVDGQESASRIDIRRGEVWWTGPEGGDLRDVLLNHAAGWLALGAPAAADYHSRFVPLADPPPAPSPRTWVVDRVAYRQIITLP